MNRMVGITLLTFAISFIVLSKINDDIFDKEESAKLKQENLTISGVIAIAILLLNI
jgi:hypothetical protein